MFNVLMTGVFLYLRLLLGKLFGKNRQRYDYDMFHK